MQTQNPQLEEIAMPSKAGKNPTNLSTSTEREWPELIDIYRVSIFVIFVLVIFLLVGLNIYMKPKVRDVIDASMTAMRDGDVDEAYSLMSNRSHTYIISLADMERLQRQYSHVFSKYQDVTITNFKLEWARANHPSLPQGTIAIVVGQLYFTDGFVEPLTATLEREDGDWRIYSLELGTAADGASP